MCRWLDIICTCAILVIRGNQKENEMKNYYDKEELRAFSKHELINIRSTVLEEVRLAKSEFKYFIHELNKINTVLSGKGNARG